MRARRRGPDGGHRDARQGPSPLSGQGTSLALVDAYQRALAEYVRLNQVLALGPAERRATRSANWRAIQLPHYGALVRGID